MDDIKTRANKAVSIFISRNEDSEVNIIEENYNGYVIAETDDCIIICDVLVGDGDDFPEENIDRISAESIAIKVMKELQPMENRTVRFDICSVVVLSGDRGILRYHKNALKEA